MNRAAVIVLALVTGCTRAVYPTPAPIVVPPTQPSPETRADTAALRAHIHALESACRQQPGAVARSLTAVDEMRAALGSLCTVESVDNDPMLWLFRCQTDAFFPLGQFSFAHRAARPCSNEPGVRGSNGWVCAGAALQRVLSQPDSGIESARVVFVGHVDQVHLQPDASFVPCPDLVHAWRYQSGSQWQTLPRGDPRLDSEGNNELAWCRAAATAQQVLCGMHQRSGGGRGAADCSRVAFDPSANQNLSFGLVGASTVWQQHQPENVCPRCPGVGTAQQCQCNAARRVDVFVQFKAREVTGAQMAQCPGGEGMNEDARALYCLQECLERRSVLAEEARLEQHDLLGTCEAGAAAPPGWIEDVVAPGTNACSDVRRDLVGRVLGIDGSP